MRDWPFRGRLNFTDDMNADVDQPLAGLTQNFKKEVQEDVVQILLEEAQQQLTECQRNCCYTAVEGLGGNMLSRIWPYRTHEKAIHGEMSHQRYSATHKGNLLAGGYCTVEYYSMYCVSSAGHATTAWCWRSSFGCRNRALEKLQVLWEQVPEEASSYTCTAGAMCIVEVS